MQRTVHQALETNRTGVTATWNNPDSGHSGTVTPTQTFQTASGQFCREYQQTVTIGGKTEAAYTAPRAVKQTAPGGSSESQPPKALGKVENGTLRKRSEKPRISHPKPPPRDHSYGQQLPSG